jgi:hypothetical protein
MPYKRVEVAYLVGPLLEENPDHIEDVIIVAIVADPNGEKRVRMRGPAHTPIIIGELVANSLLLSWEMRDDDDS